MKLDDHAVSCPSTSRFETSIILGGWSSTSASFWTGGLVGPSPTVPNRRRRRRNLRTAFHQQAPFSYITELGLIRQSNIILAPSRRYVKKTTAALETQGTRRRPRWQLRRRDRVTKNKPLGRHVQQPAEELVQTGRQMVKAGPPGHCRITNLRSNRRESRFSR